MQVFGYAPWGYEGDLVRIEVDLRRGIPGVEIVGLPGGAVREAKERLKIALRRAGFEFPQDRILINLSPADLPKNGSGYDLPMALALLAASGQWKPPVTSLLAMGELSLDARLRRVPGILAGALRAREVGLEGCAVAEEARAEASCVPDLPLASSEDLAGLVRKLERKLSPAPRGTDAGVGPSEPSAAPDLRGQPQAVRALEVSAAGGHSLLFYGPPGAGKSLAARSLEGLLPPLDPEASLETTRLWSLAGVLPRNQGLLRRRPFRAPHHLATPEGVLGGGRSLAPGEVSLAHHGVLFLDEAPEFGPRVLQGLREPLEQGAVSVVRAGRSAWFPSRFQLVMTANACPCGQTGRPKGLCLCSAHDIRRYWDRIGSPLMDRVDLRVFLVPEAPETLLTGPDGRWAQACARVDRARRCQLGRRQSPLQGNAGLPSRCLDELCGLDAARRRQVAALAGRHGWSSRGVHALLRVARTLADLDGADRPGERHFDEAAALRKPRAEEYWER